MAQGQRSNAVSRHHTLPPIINAPAPPKPKKAERRRGVWSVKGKRATEGAEAIEETGESPETPPAQDASPLPHPIPVDAAERRVHATTGYLSEGTLKAMLELQEQEGARSGDATTSSGSAAGLPDGSNRPV
jgi:hypothetical protein